MARTLRMGCDHARRGGLREAGRFDLVVKRKERAARVEPPVPRRRLARPLRIDQPWKRLANKRAFRFLTLVGALAGGGVTTVVGGRGATTWFDVWGCTWVVTDAAW